MSERQSLASDKPAPITRPNGKVWRGRLPLRWTEFGGAFGDNCGFVVFGTLDVETAAAVLGPGPFSDYGVHVEDGKPGWWREVPWDSSGYYDYSWVDDPERGTPCVSWQATP